ncbi:hypothetical protein FRY74_06155 [Vicingus serpentipes]|uniref:DUF4433 domain-containing protein n=1 Tax=Vicingus serpentipes TaxID=1926625 RepID=A0A5C6RXR3_9FLAO|nr:hypothetical protein [Vicingus serpentipes]TXB66152.1 hypothetical protein FRY74_06155 [Vicingus serpentipes]
MSNYRYHIIPNRFVYHITSKENRENILNKGILSNSNKNIGYNNAVFAHNCELINTNWYPFILDQYEWDFDEEIGWYRDSPKNILKRAIKKYYDIWRIDTKYLNRTWFIDDVGEKEFGGSFIKNRKLYIVTFGDIPKEAIRLCEIRNEKKHIIDGQNGWMSLYFPNIVKAPSHKQLLV